MNAREKFESELKAELEAKHGPLVGGADLVRLLGYRTDSGFRKALSRGTLPVEVFPLPNRRGKFCYVKDLARWLAEVPYEHGCTESSRPNGAALS